MRQSSAIASPSQSTARNKTRQVESFEAGRLAVVLIALVAVAVLVNSPGREKSQITSTVVVHTRGLHGQQVVAQGSILNNSLTFYSNDRIGVKIALMYTPFPGDPNSLRIVSINDSDGFSVASISPSPPTTLTGSTQGLTMTVLLIAPSSSYSGDLHLNVVFSVPPPPA